MTYEAKSKALNAQDIPTPRGGDWQAATVRNVLQRAAGVTLSRPFRARFHRNYTRGASGATRPAGEKFGTHSGLGLSISKQIVEAHGGTIEAENRRPDGARLIVLLPASEEEA